MFEMFPSTSTLCCESQVCLCCCLCPLTKCGQLAVGRTCPVAVPGEGQEGWVRVCSCSGPANGIRLGCPYGTCERDWGFWKVTCWVTRQSTVRNETGQGQTCVIGPQLARIMDVLADRGRRTHLCQRLPICPRICVLWLCESFVNLEFLATADAKHELKYFPNLQVTFWLNSKSMLKVMPWNKTQNSHETLTKHETLMNSCFVSFQQLTWKKKAGKDSYNV